MNLILDNIIFSLQKSGGISIYWYELIKRLIEEKQDFLCFEEDKSCQNIYRKELTIPEKQIITKVSCLPVSIRRYLPLNISKEKLQPESIFHSSYYRILNDDVKYQVVTVHDFTYEYFMSGLSKYVHIAQKKKAIDKADVIICVSQSTKRDLLKLYPEFSRKRIEVVHSGVSDAFCQLQGNHEGKVLYVGGRTGYKNFSFVVELVSRLKNYQLVIVGSPLSVKEERFLDSKLRNRYIMNVHVSEEKLNLLYNQATCLVYPSSYEGFGVPVIEAMRAGCPVIALNTSSMPEVCGDAGIMVNELSLTEFIKKVKYVEKNRNDFVDKGLAQSQKFSWSKCFNETNEIYKSLQ